MEVTVLQVHNFIVQQKTHCSDIVCTEDKLARSESKLGWRGEESLDRAFSIAFPVLAMSTSLLLYGRSSVRTKISVTLKYDVIL